MDELVATTVALYRVQAEVIAVVMLTRGVAEEEEAARSMSFPELGEEPKAHTDTW